MKEHSGTKQKIADTFIQIIKQQPLNKITVAKIMREMGMTRQIFYHHFSDIQDLVCWINEQQTQNAFSTFNDNKSLYLSELVYLNFIFENKQMYSNLFSEQGRTGMFEKIFA